MTTASRKEIDEAAERAEAALIRDLLTNNTDDDSSPESRKAALNAANPAMLTTLVAQRQMRAHVKYMKHLIQTIVLPAHRQAEAVISECPRTTPTMIQVQDQEKAALNAASQGNLTTLVAQRQVRTHVKYMKHLIQTTLLLAVVSECQAFNQAVNPLQAQTLPHFLIYPALLNGLA